MAGRLLRALALIGLAALAFAACGPEADRTRGGGPGADVGNRDDVVEMHGDQAPEERIYYQTPINETAED